MLKTLKILLIVVAVAIATIVAVALTQPDRFSVQRSIDIKAPPAKIFAILDDFRRWPEWSPWERLDPAMTRTYSGAASGPGAVYAWTGNRDVGAGRMEIVESVPPGKLDIQLDFIEPFEGHNLTEFTLQPEGDATRVTWTMSGPAPFVTKLMQVFASMDTMVGKDFESGLANLKALSER